MSLPRSYKVVRIASLFIFITLILITTSICKDDATTIGKEISPEKRVAYMCRPDVAMITNQYTGILHSTAQGEGGKPIVYIWSAPLDLPTFSTGGTGSGFIVSSDGYIVTNAHVVRMSDEDIKSSFAEQAVQYVADRYPLIYSTAENRTELFNLFISDAYRLEKKQEIKVYYGMPSGSASSPEGHPAEIRKISPEDLWLTYGNYWYRSGKDLAIIKVEGLSNLPTAILGDSSRVEVGDKVIAIGYPGTVLSMRNLRLSPETNLVPTVTSGIISAIRKLPDGSEIIQSDVTIFHGNSGGPAFDESGKVIGVTTFGSGQKLSSGEWLDIPGYNFLIPINVAKSFISELNINTTPSETAVHFQRGLEYYWSKDYSQAEGEFNSILAHGS